MCGIAGFFWTGTGNHRDTAIKMGNALSHRGPDSSGVWSNDQVGLSLIHQRLAILDLTHDGHQPMHSNSGRYTISFNGEIYNFSELKGQLALQGSTFLGTSDTEVLLASIEHWGIADTLNKIEGMFAFAVWDSKEQRVLLARDRLGEKPLYYGWISGGLCFASEISALKVRFNGAPEINHQALESYLQFGRVPSPYSIYQGIYKLPPGTWMEFGKEQARSLPKDFSPSPESGKFRPIRYWDPRIKALNAFAQPRIESLSEALEGVEIRLKHAVAQQMVADVPVGAFLSGGIDSSLLVALMQEQSPQPLQTFTIGFNSEGFNEADYAQKISRHLGTIHQEVYISPQDALEVIPKLHTICDEPLADQSVVPTYLLSALARKNITVSISGDGADEIFGGYERHIFASQFERIHNRIPYQLRKIIARSLSAISPVAIQRIAKVFGGNENQFLGIKNVSAKTSKIAAILAAKSGEELYRASSAHWANPADILLRSDPLQAYPNISGSISAITASAEKFMLLDLTHYLPDNILMKLDRAAMAVSLESRAPYLNHSLIEYSFSLSPSLKCAGNKGKILLRELLGQRVPRYLWDRPKTGFSMPLAQWLRDELRPWADDLLEGEEFSRSPLLNAPVIQKIWRQHREGKIDAHNRLWNILMFEAWNRHQSSQL